MVAFATPAGIQNAFVAQLRFVRSRRIALGRGHPDRFALDVHRESGKFREQIEDRLHLSCGFHDPIVGEAARSSNTMSEAGEASLPTTSATMCRYIHFRSVMTSIVDQSAVFG